MYNNLQKDWQLWGMNSKVLTKTVVKFWAHGMLYKAVVHMELLYGSKSTVVTVAILKVLEGFHHWAAWQIARITDWCMEDGEWE